MGLDEADFIFRSAEFQASLVSLPVKQRAFMFRPPELNLNKQGEGDEE
jgi:hypothetical protein